MPHIKYHSCPSFCCPERCSVWSRTILDQFFAFQPVSPLSTIVLLSHWCLLGDGQLGVGDTRDRAVPTLVRGELRERAVSLVAAGGCHTLCVSEGMLWSWGDGSDWLHGLDANDKLVPTRVRGELEAFQVAAVTAGGLHTACVTVGGAVFSWGYGSRGQLGLGDTNNRLVPTLITSLQKGGISDNSIGLQ